MKVVNTKDIDMKELINQIEAFLKKSPANNSWFTDGICEIYVRRAERYLKLKPHEKKDTTRTLCIDVANINVNPPGKKYFSNNLLVKLKKLSTKYQYPLYFENVHNKRFFKFLLKRGAKRENEVLPCCIWTPYTDPLTLWCNDYCVPMFPGTPIVATLTSHKGVWICGKNDLFDLGFTHQDLATFGLEFCFNGEPFLTIDKKEYS